MAQADEGYIDFKARYGEWIAIKRMSISGDTTPQKIAFHLAGIRASAQSKSYKIFGIKTEALDELSANATKGMKRKSYESLSMALSEIAKPQSQTVIAASAPEKSKTQIAREYLIGKVAFDLGLPTTIDQKALSKIYPSLSPHALLEPRRWLSDAMADGIDINSDHIIFDAKCAGWALSKSLAISAKVHGEQVAQFLMGIKEASERQAYISLGIKTKELDDFALSLKQVGASLEGAILSLSKGPAKDTVRDCVPDKKLEGVARAYLLNKVLREFS